MSAEPRRFWLRYYSGGDNEVSYSVIARTIEEAIAIGKQRLVGVAGRNTLASDEPELSVSAIQEAAE